MIASPPTVFRISRREFGEPTKYLARIAFDVDVGEIEVTWNETRFVPIASHGHARAILQLLGDPSDALIEVAQWKVAPVLV